MSGPRLPRGTVTFLVSDIERSTDLLRDDVFAAILADHRRLLRDAFATQGRPEIDTAGDGFFVAFDSGRAVAVAAVAAQRALAAVTWPATWKSGCGWGSTPPGPYLHEDGYVGVGVTRAPRICDAAWGRRILISNATAGIVEDAELPGVELVDLVEHRLKALPRKLPTAHPNFRLVVRTMILVSPDSGGPRSSSPA